MGWMQRLRQAGLVACMVGTTSCGATGGDEGGGEEENEGAALPNESEVDTATQALSGDRAALLILLKPPDGTPLAHSRSWYIDRIFGPDEGEDKDVQGLMRATSNGHFSFRSVGTFEVTDDKSAAFEAAAGVVSSDDSAQRTRKRARLLAARAGFDFSLRDLDNDGSVETNELAILVIDRYSERSGQTGFPGCINVTTPRAARVCAGVALAGHRSQLVNYAHEMSHLLSPSLSDLYGTSCLSDRQTLASCTAGGTSDSTVSFMMDPWHRLRYGWVDNFRQVNGTFTTSGEQLMGWFGASDATAKETLTFGFANRQSITFENRFKSLSKYDDGLPVDGVVAWYSQVDANGVPVKMPALDGSGGTDAGVFSLAPVNCVLRPGHADSRGQPAALKVGSSYRMRLADNTDTGLLVTIGADWIQTKISWSRTTAAASCN